MTMTEFCPDVTCGAAMVVREDEHGGFWHCRSCGQDVDDPDMNVRCRGCLNLAHRCDCGPYPNPWPTPEPSDWEQAETKIERILDDAGYDVLEPWRSDVVRLWAEWDRARESTPFQRTGT